MRELDQTSLRELARLFLRLGATAFGGPAAHIAMMQAEVVTRRGWLSAERFLDLVGATSLIPGPNSTELAIHIGWARRRWAGLLVAGVAFIAPAMLITGALAWAYVRYGALADVQWLLYGIKPVILAVVVQAIWQLAPKATKTNALRALALAAAGAALLGVHELGILLLAAIASLLAARVAARRPGASANGSDHHAAWLPFAFATPASASDATAAPSLSALFWAFCKIGSVLFGSGYVLLAFLRAEFVQRLAWLTEPQLLDAVAAGQVTPGPVFTTATFIGYLLAGPGGALIATLGIFLPAFVFVALSVPLLPRLRASPTASALLDGVNVAALVLMAVVTARLGVGALVDLPTLLLALGAAVALVRYELNATWLVVGGAIAGWLLHACVS